MCQVPLQAMLMFRVGVADETLPTRGISHLAAHLAMFALMHASDTHQPHGRHDSQDDSQAGGQQRTVADDYGLRTLTSELAWRFADVGGR